MVAILSTLRRNRPRSRAANVSNILQRHGRTPMTFPFSIYVAYPKIARRSVDDSSLQVTSMAIQNPSPDSVELGFTQVFYSGSKYHPTLYPFNASFYMLDNGNNPPFASIRTPQINKASNGTESEVPLQRVNITHMDEFTRYVLLALGSEEFTIALRGHGDLSTGALPKAGVNYDKNITMKGMFGYLACRMTERTDQTHQVLITSKPSAFSPSMF